MTEDERLQFREAHAAAQVAQARAAVHQAAITGFLEALQDGSFTFCAQRLYLAIYPVGMSHRLVEASPAVTDLVAQWAALEEKEAGRP